MHDNPLTTEEQLTSYYRLLNAFGRSYVGASSELSDELADCIQKTLLAFVARAEELHDHPSIEGWLIVTLKNNIRSLASAKKRERDRVSHSLDDADWSKETPAQDSSVEDVIITQEALLQVRQALGESDFALLHSAYGEGRPQRELAQALGIKESSFRSRLMRLKKKLRGLLT